MLSSPHGLSTFLDYDKSIENLLGFELMGHKLANNLMLMGHTLLKLSDSSKHTTHTDSRLEILNIMVMQLNLRSYRKHAYLIFVVKVDIY